MPPPSAAPTARLVPGTRVGPWCLLEARGQGSHGAVYRAVRAGQEAAGPVALKLALAPNDLRFEREAELLSRLHHPSVPRLHDSGHWRHPDGALYPYLAMQWVEGTPLYAYADSHIPSSRQVLQWLAQVARALEATHSAGCVHRDVKGDNVLVRHEDGRVFLTDFGAGRHEGASPLTSTPLPPGSPAYRPPEAWRAPSDSRHSPGPADDLFALGVTGYRLVTGGYPPSTHPADDESYLWRPGAGGPRAPEVVTRRCCKELSQLLMRLLSVAPEARGSAGELAHALEEAARRVGPEADRPLWLWPVLPPPEPLHAPPQAAPPQVPSQPVRVWLGAASVALALLLGLGLGSRWQGRSDNGSAQEARDGGSAGVAQAAAEASETALQAPPPGQPITREIPPKPLPGQTVPDTQGRCRTNSALPIHGGCWLPIPIDDMRDCHEFGHFEHQGRCYLPLILPLRPPVSSPATDGGQR